MILLAVICVIVAFGLFEEDKPTYALAALVLAAWCTYNS